jgi:16S rRNA (cytosine967-C5)-methyltransferase
VKFDNQLRHAVRIIESYHGGMPLHTWLKEFFRDNKQMGARDRRLLSTMIYGFYRLGHALPASPADERILAGLFLCGEDLNELLQYFRPGWDAAAPLAEKIAFFRQQPEGAGFLPTDIFPWKDQLSADIDHEDFCLSFLRQPDLFLRIRPGYETAVLKELTRLPVEFIPPFTLRLPNGFNVEEFFTPDRQVVIQDYSSQQVAGFLAPAAAPGSTRPRSFWDACAGSGGKSILAHDLYPGMEITVSDIRESILRNLRTRFRDAGIVKYHSVIADLTQPSVIPGADLVLADVPCTGSGTWGRTPEELYFFHPDKITRYSAIQKKIVEQLIPKLEPGATLVYCTCSVFKRENEEIGALIRDGLGLQQVMMGNIKGYERRADTLFAARFSAGPASADAAPGRS